jgi:hypothetical protein
MRTALHAVTAAFVGTALPAQAGMVHISVPAVRISPSIRMTTPSLGGQLGNAQSGSAVGRASSSSFTTNKIIDKSSPVVPPQKGKTNNDHPLPGHLVHRP